MIKLKSLLKDLDYITRDKIGDIDINKLAADSRQVEKGDLFVAISGESKDGHNYIKEALRRGASAVILQKDIDIDNFKKIKVKDTRKALALLARNFYQDPSKKIKIIGITGTNGKTTVSYLLENILKRAGFRAGLVGTIKYKVGDEVIEASNTTPSPLVLQNLIKKMVDKRQTHCIMEASSHALDQHRTDYIDFDTALFTNATEEHLDYHKNFTNYLDSKMALFRGLDKDSFAILNRDDPNFYKVKESSSSKKIISFSLKEGADIYADNIKVGMDGSTFIMHTKDEAVSIKSDLIGVHNISNMLAACGCAIAEGIDLRKIKEALESVKEIPGRLQSVDAPGEIKLFVDYAHTDDALSKVLAALNGLRKNRLITVFGCGGNRDRKKRPRMGRVAARFSDYVIITSDNPRYEEPDRIINDIVKGIKRDFKDFKVVLDRRQAIEEAIINAQEGDIVLIAGKGHERYQIIKDERIPFNDVEVASEFLKVKRECLI